MPAFATSQRLPVRWLTNRTRRFLSSLSYGKTPDFIEL
jgi:hypothetical protein